MIFSKANSPIAKYDDRYLYDVCSDVSVALLFGIIHRRTAIHVVY